MTKLNTAIQRVNELEAAEAAADLDLSEHLEQTTEKLNDPVPPKAIQKKPIHLINTMAKRQRDLLDQAVQGLVELDAQRNATEGQIDRSYDADINKLEEHRSKLLEMMRTVESDLLAMKTERRQKKVLNQTEYEANKAAQEKIIAGLRILVASLEA